MSDRTPPTLLDEVKKVLEERPHSPPHLMLIEGAPRDFRKTPPRGHLKLVTS